MKLIVGLGNPETKYDGTRHNIGFEVVDRLTDDMDVDFTKEKFNGVFYKGEDLIIAKPLTYMNLSGDFVQAITKFFKIETKDILVIHDDLDTPVGRVTMKPKGGHGGQNGMRDIQAKLGTQEITKIKVGIGRGTDTIKHVLGKFSKPEQQLITEEMPKVLKGIKAWIKGDINRAMVSLNTK